MQRHRLNVIVPARRADWLCLTLDIHTCALTSKAVRTRFGQHKPRRTRQIDVHGIGQDRLSIQRSHQNAGPGDRLPVAHHPHQHLWQSLVRQRPHIPPGELAEQLLRPSRRRRRARDRLLRVAPVETQPMLAPRRRRPHTERINAGVRSRLRRPRDLHIERSSQHPRHVVGKASVVHVGEEKRL